MKPAWTAALNPGKPAAYGSAGSSSLQRRNGCGTNAHAWFGTVIERFTAERLTIVVLCNRTDSIRPSWHCR